MDADPSGRLRLGYLFDAAGLYPDDVMVIRHTIKGLQSEQAESFGPSLVAYTRSQLRRNSKVPKDAPRIWLNFLATTGRRARFLTAYENHGEVSAEQTERLRFFDLRPSEVFAAHAQRLVIEWTADTVNWAKTGPSSLMMPVVQIADPTTKPFPGFDSIIVSYEELQAIMIDDGYAEWRTALSSVKGIYLIADLRTSQLYVGKADGAEGFLGRWGEYARTGHGGNVALRELDDVDLTHREYFQFSILQVFSPSAPMAQVDAAEVHFKKALLTRRGLNRN